MSTKTSIKRIAAVAAVALTLGGFSAVSAHAATTGTALLPTVLSVADTGAAGANGAAVAAATGTAIAGARNYVQITVAANTPNLATGHSLVVSTSGAGSNILSTSGTSPWTLNNAAAAAGTLATAATSTAAAVIAGDSIKVNTPTAGTVTITVADETLSNGAYTDTTLQTYTITVGAASVAGQVSVANSTSYITDSSTVLQHNTATDFNTDATNVSADATVIASKALTSGGAANRVATVLVTLNDTQVSTKPIKSAKLSVSITGSGLIAGNNAADAALGTGSSPARSANSYTSSASGVAAIGVYSDGTAGTGTITVSYTDANAVTTVISTETVTFYGSIATLSATQNLKVAPAAGGTFGYTGAVSAAGFASTPAITLKAVDSAGNLVKGLTAANFYATSSDTTVMSNTITVTEDGVLGLNGGGYYNVQVNSVANTSGKSATLTVYYSPDAGVTKYSAAPVTFTLGGSTIYGLTLTSDAASYAPGQLVTLTATATDKAGNSIADGAYNVFGASFAGLTFSASVTSAVLATTSAGTTTFLSGAKAATFYAPYNSGTVSFSGAFDAVGTPAISVALATAGKVTGSISVANPADAASQAAVDAANEATDAANAATDAANNAMDSADAAQQAALDAGDKADAALAAVTDLATKVSAIATQIAALSALVKKIAAKVKA
jgi:hypothetical protein